MTMPILKAGDKVQRHYCGGTTYGIVQQIRATSILVRIRNTNRCVPWEIARIELCNDWDYDHRPDGGVILDTELLNQRADFLGEPRLFPSKVA